MASTRHLTMRGEVIDMEKLRITNGDQVALGNASKNARGDIVGQGGVVLKTQEQIESEWAANRAKRDAAAKPVDLKAEQGLAQAISNISPRGKSLAVADQDFGSDMPPPVAAPVASPAQEAPQQPARRRVVESDQ